MRAQAADKHRVAVQQHVLWGHRGAQPPLRRGAHELHSLPRGDVLQHHTQRRYRVKQRSEHVLKEARLAVEDVNLAASHLAVHQQRQPRRGHGLQRRAHLRRRWHVSVAAAHMRAALPRALRTSVTPSALLVVAPAG